MSGGPALGGRAPDWGTRLLRLVLTERDAEAVAGDLTEEYALRARSAGRASAAAWYAGQILASLPPLAWARFREGAWLVNLGVALAAYLAASLLELGAGAAISALAPSDSGVDVFLSLAAGLAAFATAGYVAARVRRGAVWALAVIIAAVVVVLMATMSDSAPLWYQIAFLLLGPAAALAGGAWSMGRAARNRR